MIDLYTLIFLLGIAGLAVVLWLWNERDEKHFNEMYPGGNVRDRKPPVTDSTKVVENKHKSGHNNKATGRK